MILELIDEAVTAGARRHRACEVAGLDTRTVERWRKRPDGDDLRRGPKTRPANALTDEEQARIVELATAPEFVGLSPHQLVPKLADMAIFIGSESSVYRVLRRRRLLKHRDRSKPRSHHRPRALVATGPNQVWAWDITYLPAGVRGTFWYLSSSDGLSMTCRATRSRPSSSTRHARARVSSATSLHCTPTTAAR